MNKLLEAMKKLILALLVTLLISCDDVVSSEYSTYQEADSDQLFGRGWLPEIIPFSATSIETQNDLDSNTSNGGFKFSGDISNFINELETLKNKKVTSSYLAKFVEKGKVEGLNLYLYSDQRSIWAFAIDFENGYVGYRKVYDPASNKE